MPKLSLKQLQSMKNNQKISMLTLYDATFAHIASKTGVDILLIGDSLSMTLKGNANTLDVNPEDIAYHTRCVAAGNQGSVIMADLPFMSYYNVDTAALNSKLLLQAGAEILKIEGGAWLSKTIQFLSERGIPICAHIGLTPQFLHVLGGFKVQGRNEEQATTLLNTAIALEQAGAAMIVIECVPHSLAKIITERLTIPVIGIGAGPYCDGQVLVLYDMLGLSPFKQKKFVKNFMEDSENGIAGAIEKYVTAVKEGTFPTLEHSFE